MYISFFFFKKPATTDIYSYGHNLSLHDVLPICGRVSAIEASADGLDLTFAPMVDITRDPRWGRTSEGFGEDPYLVSQIAGTLVRAYQGERLSAADRDRKSTRLNSSH